MKNKNKTHMKKSLGFFLLSLLVLGGTFPVYLLLKADFTMYVVLGLLLLSTLLLIIGLFMYAYEIHKVRKQRDLMLLSVDMRLEGERRLVKVVDQDYIDFIASLNNLISDKQILRKNYLYEFKDFLPSALTYLKSNPVEDICFMRIVNVSKEDFEYLNEKFNAYFGLSNAGLDIIYPNYQSREEIEKIIEDFIHMDERRRGVIAYTPDIDFDEIMEKLTIALEGGEVYQVLEGNKDSLPKYYALMKEYLGKDLRNEEILESFMKETLPYLPLTHVSIFIGLNAYKEVALDNYEEYSKYDEEEFPYINEYNLLDYMGVDVTLLLANKEYMPSLTNEDEKKITLFISLLNNMLIYKVLDLKELRANKEKEELLNIIHSYSYHINHDYIITEASRGLLDVYGQKLIGQADYKVMYQLKKAPTSYPYIIPKLGSNKYERVVITKENGYDVYLIDRSNNIVKDKVSLLDRLLALINNDERGYLLGFKIEGLENLANKNKVAQEVIVMKLKDILGEHNLLDNLYQKEDDEFIYLLENVGREETYILAEKLSLSLNEKILLNNKPVNIGIKVIAMSYPLEVSTLFDLDSLCRTLFERAEKKGKLYRIEEDPLNIDRRKYLLELLEESFKKDNIPTEIIPIIDKEKKLHLYDVVLKFSSENGESIKEDEITLIAKQERYYNTLIERLIKGLNFKGGKKYIVPLAREGLNEPLFSSLENLLKRMKASITDVVFEVREKDIKDNLEVYSNLVKKGFLFALGSIDTSNKTLDASSLLYVRVERGRLVKDKLYQLKLTSLMNEGVSLLDKGSENKQVRLFYYE